MRIKAEVFRIERRIHVPATFGATRLFGTREASPLFIFYIQNSVAVAVAAFKRFHQTGAIVFFHHNRIDDSEQLLFAGRNFRQREFHELVAEVNLAVALFRENLGKLQHVLDFERGKHRDFLVQIAVEGILHQVARAVRRHGLPAFQTMRGADPRPENAEVVINFGEGRHRRARALARTLLVDSDGRRQARNGIDAPVVGAAQEATGIRAQRFHKAALAFAKERMEREARLAGARNARHHSQLVARNRDVDVLEVVLAGTMHLNIQRQIFAALERTVKVVVFAMLFRKHRREIAARLGLLALCNLFRRTRRNHATTMNARIRAQVDNPVGTLDHVQVMFDNHDTVAETAQTIQTIHELADVFKVQARRRFVKQVKRLSRTRTAQLRSNFNALRLSPAERCRRLAQSEVAEAHFQQQVQRLCHRDVLEEFRRIGDAHVENFGDVLALEINFTRRIVKALAAAHFASHLHAGQNVHVDDFHASAFARIATSALHVETETALAVPANFAFFHAREKVAHVVPNLGVRRRIASRRAANRRLVDFNHLVDILEAFQVVELSDRIFGIVEHASQFATQNLVNQSALAGARNTRHHGQSAIERNFHIDVLEVIFRRTANLEFRCILVNLLSLLGNLDCLAATQVRTRQRSLVLLEFLDGPCRNHATAFHAGTRTHVNHAVRMAHGVFVVFHDNQGVALRTQMFEHPEQLIVIAGVEPDARLIKHIKHALQAGAHCACKPDSLRLATAQGGRLAVDIQVAKPHRIQERKPSANLFQNFLADSLFLLGQVELVEELHRFLDGPFRHLGQIMAVERDRVRRAVDARAVAFGANTNLHVLAEVVDVPHIPQFLHDGDNPAFRFTRRAVQYGILLRLLEFVPRRIERKMHLVCDVAQVAAPEVAENQRAVVLLDSRDTAFLDGLRLVRDNQVQVELVTFAHALTGGAAALRVVKAEEPRFQFRNGDAALRASKQRALQAILFLPLACRQQEAHQLPVSQFQRAFQRLAQTAHVLAFKRQAVNHRLNRVLLVTHERRNIFQAVNRAVHAGTHKAIFLEFGQLLAIFTLALLHNRRHHRNLLAFVAHIQIIDNLVHRLSLNHAPAIGAVRHAQARKKQAVMVQNFHHRTHRGTRVTVHRLLVNRNRRRNAAHALHLGVLHAADKLARICRKRLHETPLAFLEHRIEGKARLARTGHSGHHHDGIAGNGKVHMAKVMLVRVTYLDGLGHAPQYRKRRPSRLIFSEHLCKF